MNIVACCGVCNLGQLSVEAGRIVAEQDNGNLYSLGKIAASRVNLDNIKNVLAINGCEKACADKILTSLHIDVKWRLDISNLGIEKSEGGQTCKDDLVLVLDAIEAVCAVVHEPIPNGGALRGCC